MPAIRLGKAKKKEEDKNGAIRLGKAAEPKKTGFIQKTRDKISSDVQSGKFGEEAARRSKAGESPNILPLTAPAIGISTPVRAVSLLDLRKTKAAVTTAKSMIKVAGKKINAESVRKVATMFKTTEKNVLSVIEQARFSKEIASIVNKMSAADIALKTGKTILKIGGAIASADVLFQWYALDNVITGQKFFLGDIDKGVKDGSLKPDQAREALKTSAETRKIAIDKVILSNSINPLLWAFRNLILTGIEADDAALDLKVTTIENAIAEREEEDARLEAGGEPELTSQEQFEANQESIKTAQDERDAKADQRDQDFQDRQDERDEELRIREAERDLADDEKTLFFEALSKRNAGQALTDEEKQLLLDRGINPDRIIQQEQRSNLNFGLI